MKKKDNPKEEPKKEQLADSSNSSNLESWLKSYKDGTIDDKKLKSHLEKYFYSKRYLVDRALVFDRDRKKISGICEVIYGEGKSFEQLFEILKALEKEKVKKILITRLSYEKWKQLKRKFSLSHHASHPASNPPTKEQDEKEVTATKEITAKTTTEIITLDSSSTSGSSPSSKDGEKVTLVYDSVACIASSSRLDKKALTKTDIVIVSAGTSDEKIARETQISLEFFNRRSTVISDVGVAGLGRLLGRLEEINQYKLIIAIAGMEASLPTVLSSLSPKPIIAVPTSVGHGANFGGISALLSLLSSCSPGIGVVNINSGFSAATLADKLLHAFEQR